MQILTRQTLPKLNEKPVLREFGHNFTAGDVCVITITIAVEYSVKYVRCYRIVLRQIISTA